MRMLKSHLQVASTQVGVGFRLSNEQYLAARDRIKTDLCWHSLHNTRSMLQCIVGDILHDYFIKFNVHVRLQGLGLPAQQELTPWWRSRASRAAPPGYRLPPNTIGRLLQCIVRDIHYNNFIQFNVHSRLQGLGLPGQRELTPRSLHCGETSPAHRKVRSPLRTTSSHF